ncbi:hypothetical protein PanWU01x14_131960 [Parasponia andersonii]|uniref:Uncharacterized protein n=1 Tax=Parasponia andersonii TaxID=3476 RepID=A0A2P5CQK5_PARAD|nr:hypothetical protein PanWU01x14_131960 [Parasponia andersonii]
MDKSVTLVMLWFDSKTKSKSKSWVVMPSKRYLPCLYFCSPAHPIYGFTTKQRDKSRARGKYLQVQMLWTSSTKYDHVDNKQHFSKPT